MFSIRVAATLALCYSLVAGIAFTGPAATPIVHKIDANGWTPKPTSQPRAAMGLFKRQEDDPSFCGYLEGDPGLCC